jgi:hypothetical protein
MPPFAVPAALKARQWDADHLTPEQVYRLANFFGVSYGALLNHMYFALRTIKQDVFNRLDDIPAKATRARICPNVVVPHLVVVDRFWQDRPVDLDAGDAVLLPRSINFSEELLERVACPEANGIVCIARQSGVGLLTNPLESSSIPLRICPTEFNGFAKYRFPEKNNVYHTT